MQNITREMIDHFIFPTSDLNILDAGCGTGAGMSTTLADYGRVSGFDISPLALKNCRKRNLSSLAQASVMEIPCKSGCLDLVTSFDVLYERAVTDDSVAMSEFFRVLRPAGFVLLRLPAYDWLRGQHDLTVHTARRYTAKQVADLLMESGFRIVHLSYANPFLFPLALAKRLMERIRPASPGASDLLINVGVLNYLFKQILSREAFWITRCGLPFGLSVIALGQKPAGQ